MTLITDPRSQTLTVRTRAPGERRSRSSSAARALDVLECFGCERRWLRAIEIAQMLGLQGSTTNQILKTMLDSAHLVFDVRSKTYFPSPRLAGFSALMIEAYQDERLILLVKELHERTGLSVTLTTPNGPFMQVLEVERQLAHKAGRGLKIDLFGTAIGSAYLASLPDAGIADMAARAGMPPHAVAGILDHAEVVRRDGYADGRGINSVIWSIAMALPPALSPVPLVLSVAGDQDWVEPRGAELRATMRAAIAGLTASPDAARQASSVARSSAIVAAHDETAAKGS